MKSRVVGGLGLLAISLGTTVSAQQASIPTELPPRERATINDFILKNSNPEAIDRLRDLLETEQRKARRHFEMFLLCDGENGNSSMSIDYGDPDYYAIIDGKCKYIGYQGGGM